jgi:hypothetical protein
MTPQGAGTLCLIIGLLIGFAIGTYANQFRELNWCADQAVKMLHVQGYDVKMDTKLITLALVKYGSRFEYFVNQSQEGNNGTRLCMD